MENSRAFYSSVMFFVAVVRACRLCIFGWLTKPIYAAPPVREVISGEVLLLPSLWKWLDMEGFTEKGLSWM